MGKTGTRNPLAAPIIVPRNVRVPLTPEEIAQWEEAEARLHAEIVAQIEQLYQIVVRELGPEEADQVWKKVVAAKPKGRPPRPQAPALDRELLRLHDSIMKTEHPPSLACIGRRIYDMTKNERGLGKYGNSARTVTMKLRRLLKRREERLRQQRELGNPLLWRHK
jgi:hypothetical protein